MVKKFIQKYLMMNWILYLMISVIGSADASTELALLTGPSLARHIVPEIDDERKADLPGSRIGISNAAGDINASVRDAKKTYDILFENSRRLDAEYDALERDPAEGVWGLPQMVFGGIDMLRLPTDFVDNFDHRRWAENLAPANNAGNAYLNITAYPATTLADGLYVSAKYCTGHSTTSGHCYTGTGTCCNQPYTRGMRIELLTVAKMASQHSKKHAAYVDEFNYFESRFRAAHSHYLSLPGYHYPAMPRNSYVPFNFQMWLVQLAANNSAAGIQKYTDSDDAGLMADYVYTSCRHGACGHGVGNQYTSLNHCSVHHTRSIRVEMFQTAIDLANNQNHHNNYVREAQAFEAEAKRIMAGYLGRPFATVAGFVAPPPLPGVTIRAGAGGTYQSLKDNRSRLRDMLGVAMTTLKSVADDGSGKAHDLVRHTESFADEISAHREAQQAAEQKLNLLTLQIQVKIEDYERRLEGQKPLVVQAAKIPDLESQIAQFTRNEEDVKRNRERLARSLGMILYQLNGRSKDDDRRAFLSFTDFEALEDEIKFRFSESSEVLRAEIGKLKTDIERLNSIISAAKT